MTKEKKAYKILQEWLRRNDYHCEKNWLDIGGTSKYRIDVVGIKNISEGWSHDNIEIVALEAKRWLQAKSLSQAENYFDIANRVYVVQVQWADDVQDKIRHLCLTKGLGLITVKGTRCKEIIEARPVQHNNEAARISFLEKLRVVKCIICGKYFRYDKEKKAYWIKSTRGLGKKKRGLWKAICEDCSKCYSGQMIKELYGDVYDDLYKRTERLEKRYKRLEKRISQFE